MPAWTAHEDGVIRTHAKTHSATQIAGLLEGRSRAAVTGRAWRLGASLAKDDATRRELEHPKRRRSWADGPPLPPPAAPDAWPKVPRAALKAAARVTPRMLPLERVAERGCRWPYGEETVRFCGEPAAVGSAYCRGHHGLAYVPQATGYDAEAWAKAIARHEARTGTR